MISDETKVFWWRNPIQRTVQYLKNALMDFGEV